jgi:tetratricopeptide (TPR) repeat protein
MWWSRVRGWWLLVAGAAGGAVIAAAAQSVTGAAWAAVLTIAGAIVAAVSERGRSVALQGRSRWTDHLVHAVPVSGLADPVKLGVHPAATHQIGAGVTNRVPPFVVRDHLDEAKAGLLPTGFLLIVGDSAAGKSRLAFEAMRAALPDHICVYPTQPQALQAAIERAKIVRPSVLWLDDLERYLQPGGLSDTQVSDLLNQNPPGITIVSTMRAGERAQLSSRYDPAREYSDQQLARSGRSVLAQVTSEVLLPRLWSQQELDQARTMTSDPRIAAALRAGQTHGLAEYLAAGPQLLQDFQDARATVNPGPRKSLEAPARGGPRGAALVNAAIDVRRCGQHNPVPLALLQELHEGYLQAWGGPALRPEPWEVAMAWATHPLHGTSSMLEPFEPGFLAFDYLVDTMDNDTSAPPVPVATWRAVIRQAGPNQLPDIAWRASLTGLVTEVEAAYSAAMTAREYLIAADVAASLGEAGHEQIAADMLATIIEQAESVPEFPAEDLLSLRHSLAWQIGSKSAPIRTGDPARAKAVARQVVDDATALHGPTHQVTIMAKLTWIRQLGSDGEPQRALDLARRTAADATSMHGAQDQVTQSARFELAVWARRNHHLAEAADIYEALVEWARDQPRLESFLMDSLWNLSGCLGALGDYQRAKQFNHEALEMARATYGYQHINTLEIRMDHSALVALDDPQAAIVLDTELVEDCEQTLGASHSLTVAAREQQDLHRSTT